jgi:UDP-glucose 4-epimerase
MNILVTGGTGYIGSHTCVYLLQAGHHVTIVDNLCNSSIEVLERIKLLGGKPLDFVLGDIRDEATLSRVFATNQFDAVVHFAGLKAVGESVQEPLRYYDNNVTGTLVLLRVMQAAAVRTLVFSSSATVYGDSPIQPVHEDLPLSATNPYGQTKLVIEGILRDLCIAESNWRIAALRYFNPVGAHDSGLIGEDPNIPANNLMPYVGQVALGRREFLGVFGNDYPTVDGTGVRDYIHVMDLAAGHAAALTWLGLKEEKLPGDGFMAINLGTGKGTSVLELISAFEAATGITIPHKIVARRPGDVACSFADASLSRELLGWVADRSVAQMCADTWRWLKDNPQGYLNQ